jgi:hypothetical protein
MYFIDTANKKKTRVEGDEFEGLGLKKYEIINHIEQLRALCYSIINILIMGNSRLTIKVFEEVYPSLAMILMSDARVFGNSLRKSEENNYHSEELNKESLELMLNALLIKEIYDLFQG